MDERRAEEGSAVMGATTAADAVTPVAFFFVGGVGEVDDGGGGDDADADAAPSWACPLVTGPGSWAGGVSALTLSSRTLTAS